MNVKFPNNSYKLLLYLIVILVFTENVLEIIASSSSPAIHTAQIDMTVVCLIAAAT